MKKSSKIIMLSALLILMTAFGLAHRGVDQAPKNDVVRVVQCGDCARSDNRDDANALVATKPPAEQPSVRDIRSAIISGYPVVKSLDISCGPASCLLTGAVDGMSDVDHQKMLDNLLDAGLPMILARHGFIPDDPVIIDQVAGANVGFSWKIERRHNDN
jgi:hypothetical protein